MPKLEIILDSSKARQAAEELKKALAQAGAAAGTAGDGLDKAGRKATIASRAMGVLRSSVMNLYTALGGAGLVFAARNAIRTMSEFEDTMATLRGVAVRTNQTIAAQREQYELLETAARKMGATTRFTAAQAADGLLFLARAGFSVSEAIEALPATLNLAQAGNIGLGEAADFASNVLKQFSLETKETARVVDAMVIVSNRANTDVRQLANAMKYAGPIAQSMGVSVEVTSAAIGVLSDAGIQAEMAGTGLRRVLSDLAKESPKLNESLRKMGLSYKDVDLRSKSLSQAMRALGDANMTAGQALDLFGIKGATAGLVMSRAADQIENLTDATQQFAGEAGRMAELRTTTIAGKAKNLASAWQELTLAGGDKGLLGVLKNQLDFFTLLLRAIAGVEESSYDLALSWEYLKYKSRSIVEAIPELGKHFAPAAPMGAPENTTQGLSAAELRKQEYDKAVLDILAQREAAEQKRLHRDEELLQKERERVEAVKAGLVAGRKSVDMIEEQDDATTDLTAALQKYKEELKFVVDLGLVSEEKRDRALQLYKLEQQMRQAGIKDIDGEKKAIEELLASLDKLNEQLEAQAEIEAGAERYRKKWADQARQQQEALDVAMQRIDTMRLENALTGELENTKRKVMLLYEMEQHLKRAGISDTEAVLAQYAKEIDLLQRMEKLQNVSRGIGDAFGRMAEDIIVDFKSIGDAFKSLLKDIQRALVQEMISKPIAQQISSWVMSAGKGLFSGLSGGGGDMSSAQIQDILYQDLLKNARGNAFRHGNVVPFGAGDIFSRPTFFPMSGSRTGVLGEAGAEGILPLGRDAQGRLGVRMVGGDSGGRGPVNVTINVATPNVDGFRKSERQIVSATRRALQRV